MAIALVQSRKVVVTGVNSQAVSFLSTPTVGNNVIVKASTYSGDLGTSAASDNQGNSYNRRGYVALAGMNTFVAIYEARITTASGTFTVTVNPDGTSADLTIIIEEWSGIASSGFDKAVNADSSSDGTSATTGNITPAENNEAWFAALTHAGADMSITPTNGTQVDENEGGSSNIPLSSTYKVQTTATAEAATWTLGTSTHWGCCVVAFKAAAGASDQTISLAAATITATGQTAAITVPAHTFDTSARLPSSGTSTSNPLTGSYTCGAGATVLTVMLKYANSTSRTGGAPTYNGIALTQADITRKAASSPEGCAELWYLLNPPTGSSYTVSIPNSNTKTMVAYVASAKACPGYASALDVAGGNTGTSTNPTASVTTTVVGDILFAVVFNGATTWAPSGRTGTQLYDSDDGAWGGGSQYLIKTDTGSQAMAWTFGTSDDWGECVAAFKQIAPTVISLSAASITATGQNLTVDAGTAGVTISLAAGTVTASGQSLSILPGAVTTYLSVASLTATGQALTVVPGAVSTSLSAAAVTTVGQALTVLAPPPGDVTISLSAASVTAAGQNLTVIPGAVGISLAAGTITATGQIITVDAPAPGVVTVNLSAASITASGQSLNILPGAVNISLSAASITAGGQSLQVTPGAVTTSLSAAALQSSGQRLTILPGEAAIQLNAAGIHAIGQSLTILPGAVSLEMAAAVVQAVGQTLTVHAYAFTVTPDWRIYRVEAENRIYFIEAEDRTENIGAENRVCQVEVEDRSLAIQAEDRTYLVERIGYENN